MTALLDRLPRHQRWAQQLRRLLKPASLGALRRTTPVSDVHGFDRGTPVDRYYIERFLENHRQDIRGDILEMGDSRYTYRYGTAIARAEVLDIVPTNRNATIVADLSAADVIPADSFDCFLLIQTLHLIYDVPAALDHAQRILRPGGVLLATVPGVGRGPNPGDGTAYWSFTAASCERLLGEAFGDTSIAVRAYGNVLICVGRLLGLACEDLSPAELEVEDPRFPLVVAVRAVKRAV